ncbi:MAG: helix-turn-helix domain-containing protein [Desulfobacterales bacterium]
MSQIHHQGTTYVENTELKLAMDFAEQTGNHIFLTGKAGTGKTTFLSELKKRSAKRMVITAPTGVAAITAGGVTLHSFFQLPFGPFIPGSEAKKQNKQQGFRFSKAKKRLIRNLDLLVIDEISMVRADLLDAVDAVLRRHRRIDRPFGGVQLLLIGDLHQLSPVAKPEEWRLLQPLYDSPYFFCSRAINRTELTVIELKHIFRQSDAEFISLLNRVRDNRLDAAAVAQLNSLYVKNDHCDPNPGTITLTTHNRKADIINTTRLRALPEKEFRFKAEVTGDFPESAFPVPATLTLKKGAQVMFMRNDPSAEKRYFNGKIGEITSISHERISVACPGEDEINIEPLEWENITYAVTEDGKGIREEIIGKLKQFPLKPAWAITIHKSQGLTFDNVVIDAQAAFAHGQFYVALSRCRTLDGLKLSSPIPSRSIGADDAVNSFIRAAGQNAPSEKLLMDAKVRYQQRLLLDCFDLDFLQNRFNAFCRLLSQHADFIQVSGVPDIRQLRKTAAENIFTVSVKFKQQLTSLFSENSLPETDSYLQERIRKASGWFQEKFAEAFDPILKNFQAESDNKEIAKRIDKAHADLKREVAKKMGGIQSCEDRFSPPTYLRAAADSDHDFASRKQKQRTPDYTESDITHPELFQQLKAWRSEKAEELNVARFLILHQRVLVQIAVWLPDNVTDLKKINGVGSRTVQKYGDEITAMVAEYRKKEGIETVSLPDVDTSKNKEKPAKKTKPKGNTREISLDMFKNGHQPEHIARERGLALSTIEGHLAFFVENGELDVSIFVNPEKQAVIDAVLEKNPNSAFKPIKEKLGEGFSYGEIRMMAAHRRYLASKTGN